MHLTLSPLLRQFVERVLGPGKQLFGGVAIAEDSRFMLCPEASSLANRLIFFI